MPTSKSNLFRLNRLSRSLSRRKKRRKHNPSQLLLHNQSLLLHNQSLLPLSPSLLPQNPSL